MTEISFRPTHIQQYFIIRQRIERSGGLLKYAYELVLISDLHHHH